MTFWARMLCSGLFQSCFLSSSFSPFQAIGSEDITQYFTLQGILAMPSSATADTIGNMENRQMWSLTIAMQPKNRGGNSQYFKLTMSTLTKLFRCDINSSTDPSELVSQSIQNNFRISLSLASAGPGDVLLWAQIIEPKIQPCDLEVGEKMSPKNYINNV